MVWIAFYAALAMVTATAVFLLADRLREPGVPTPHRPGRWAMVAGLLWPVLVVGLAQCGLIVIVRKRLRRATRPSGTGGTRAVPLPAVPLKQGIFA